MQNIKMTCCSVQPRDRIFVKGDIVLFFVKNMGKNICKNISRNLSSEYSQKHLDHAKKSATDFLETAAKKQLKKQQLVI